MKTMWRMVLLSLLLVGACRDNDDSGTQERPSQPKEGSTHSDQPPRTRNSNASLRALPDNGRAPIIGKTAIYPYSQFNPQALAFGLGLGMAWYSWIAAPQLSSDVDVEDHYEIMVVVYRDMSIAEAQRHYPTVEGHSDYRLISFDDAVTGLDRALEDMGEEPTLQTLAERVLALRQDITTKLGLKTP